MDVGLDTLPYNGHTIKSLDSYWMGVPVVTLVGKTVVGRAGVSQLMNLGLEGMCGVERRGICGDRGRGWRGMWRGWAKLRGTLRGGCKLPVLMDGKRFTKNIEAAYGDAEELGGTSSVSARRDLPHSADDQ